MRYLHGLEDTRRRAPTRSAWTLGARVQAVDAGARTLKEATSAAIRDWATTVGDTHYVIGSVVGSAPYPALVRPAAGDRRRGARPDVGREGRLPARGSPASVAGPMRLGSSPPFQPIPTSSWSAEAGGEGIDTHGEAPRHGAPLTGAARRGPAWRPLGRHAGRGGPDRRSPPISAGLHDPVTGPQHAFLRDSGRARDEAVTDRDALAAFRQVSRLEGIIPALETAHALAWVLAQADGDLDLVCLSGRGDKDLAEALAQ